MAQATHWAATTQEEEDLALALALSASLHDAQARGHTGPASPAAPPRPIPGTTRPQAASGPASGPPRPPAPAALATSVFPSMPAYPNIPPAGSYPPVAGPHHAQRPHVPPQAPVPPAPRPTLAAPPPVKAATQTSSTQQQQAQRSQPSSAPQQASQPYDPKKCGRCGKGFMWGVSYVSAMGRNWHRGCLRCALCDEALEQDGSRAFVTASDGQGYHTDCHKVKFHPSCYICDSFIPARPDGRIEFKELQFWRHKYCPQHAAGQGGDVAQCCSCSRFKQRSAPEWVSLSDGRDLCLECVSSIVVDTKDAQPLYEEVLAFYKSMGMTHPHKAPCLLVDAPTLQEYSNKEGRDTHSGGPVFHVRGLTLATVYSSVRTIVRVKTRDVGGLLPISSTSTPIEVGPAATTCSVSAILIMYGLPRLLTGCIMAHELMHAWLRMRHVTGLDLQVEEGLCQLMAMLWLDQQHDKMQGDSVQQRLASYFGFQIREDTSTVYGDGFRIAYDAFQRHGGGMRGVMGVINSVLSTGRIA